MEKVLLDSYEINGKTHQRHAIKGEEKRITTVVIYDNGRKEGDYLDLDWFEDIGMAGIVKYFCYFNTTIKTLKNRQFNGVCVEFTSNKEVTPYKLPSETRNKIFSIFLETKNKLFSLIKKREKI